MVQNPEVNPRHHADGRLGREDSKTVRANMGLSQQRYKKYHRNWRRSGSIGMLICNCFGLVPTKERDATLGIS